MKPKIRLRRTPTGFWQFYLYLGARPIRCLGKVGAGYGWEWSIERAFRWAEGTIKRERTHGRI